MEVQMLAELHGHILVALESDGEPAMRPFKKGLDHR